MIDTEIYFKITRYCAYSERTNSDVKTKLRSLKIEAPEFEEYLVKLRDENYLSEDRFAKAFVAGHLRKKWGKLKIKSALRGKGISNDVIDKYLEEAEDSGYDEVMLTLAERKLRTVKGKSASDVKNKMYRFLMSKGYEGDKIKAVLKKLSL